MNNGVSYITGAVGRGKSSAIMEIIRRSYITIICTPTHASRKVIQRRVEKNNLQAFCRADVGAYATAHASKYSREVRMSTSFLSKREKDLFHSPRIKRGTGNSDSRRGLNDRCCGSIRVDSRYAKSLSEHHPSSLCRKCLSAQERFKGEPLGRPDKVESTRHDAYPLF